MVWTTTLCTSIINPLLDPPFFSYGGGVVLGGRVLLLGGSALTTRVEELTGGGRAYREGRDKLSQDETITKYIHSGLAFGSYSNCVREQVE